MMEKKEQKEFKINSFDSETRLIEGYITTFGNVDRYGDVVLKGSTEKLRQKTDKEVKLLWQHDFKNPIGYFKSFDINDTGVLAVAYVDDIPEGDRVLKQLESGTLDSFSIAYRIDDFEMSNNYGKGNLRMLKAIDIIEASVVTYPVNSNAKFTNFKSKYDDNIEVKSILNELNNTEAKKFEDLIDTYVKRIESLQEDLKNHEIANELNKLTK